jgi:hypothetical protein
MGRHRILATVLVGISLLPLRRPVEIERQYARAHARRRSVSSDIMIHVQAELRDRGCLSLLPVPGSPRQNPACLTENNSDAAPILAAVAVSKPQVFYRKLTHRIQNYCCHESSP